MDQIDELAKAIEQIEVVRDCINDFLYSLPSDWQLDALDKAQDGGDCGCDSYTVESTPPMFEYPEIYLEVITLKADIVKKLLPKLEPAMDAFMACLSDIGQNGLEDDDDETDEEMD